MPVPFRYRKLGYVALNVTDIARTTEFATRTFVLENTGTGPSGEQFLSCGPEHHDLVLYQNKEPGFVRGAWELESPEDVERAYAHYDSEGKCHDQDYSRRFGQSPASQQSHRRREQEREQNREGQRQKDRLGKIHRRDHT